MINKKTVLEKLTEVSGKSEKYLLEEMEFATSEKEKKDLWKLYLKTAEQNSALRQVIVDRIFSGEHNEKANEEIFEIESEIEEVRENLGNGYNDYYYEVYFDDFFVEIEKWEIEKYGLDVNDKLKIAVIIHYFHRED